MPLRSLPALTPDGVIVEVAANSVTSERSSLFIFIVSYIVSFPCPFGYNGRLVSHPLSEDACISVLAAYATSMLESGRQDHAQGTQPPTQSPTQSRHGCMKQLLQRDVGARFIASAGRWRAPRSVDYLQLFFIHPYAIGELQAYQAGAIMCLDTFSCSLLQLGRTDAALLSRRGDNGHDDWFSAAFW